MKTRVLFVGRTRYRLPLPSWLERKWDAVGDALDYRVLASAADGARSSGRFELIGRVGGRGRLRVLRAAARSAFARAIRRFRPEAIVAEDPRTATLVMLGRRLAGSPRAKVICEVHGDWRHSDAPLRHRWAAPLVAARRRARPLRRAPRRRRARALALHGDAREGRARRAAGRRLPDVHRPLGVHRAPAAAAARDAHGALRRRARALQERRRARRRLAARRGPSAGRAARRRRQRAAARRTSRSSRPSCRDASS